MIAVNFLDYSTNTASVSVGIDLARLFSDAFSQQSQQVDANGNYTLTAIYCEFYCELLHRASLGQLMYSDHLKVGSRVDEY